MGGIPRLVKAQSDYKAQGFVVVASHCQDVPKEKVVGLCRAKHVNYTVTNGGGPRGDESHGIPHAWLFDASGKLVKEGHPEELYSLIPDLLAKEPHWITGGKKLESAAKSVGEGLKAGKSFGWALGECESLLKKKDEKAVAEATFLKEQILAEGERLLEQAKALEGENAFKAERTYEEAKAVFKKTDVASKAEERLKELKKDKAHQEEVKVGKLACQAEELVGELKEVNGKVNLDNPANQATAGQLAGIAKQLKKFPESPAAKKALEELKTYGF